MVIVNAGPDGVYNGQAFDMDLGDRFREHKDAAMEGEKKCFYDFWRAAGLMAAHQYLLIEMEPDDAGEFLRLRDGQHVAVSKLEAWYVLP